jgi:hypothetical protein
MKEVFPVPVCPITAINTSLGGEYGDELCSVPSVVAVEGLSGSESESMEDKVDSVVSAPVILAFPDSGPGSIFLPAVVVGCPCGGIDVEVSSLAMVAS